MKAYDRMKLWKASFDKHLFKTELEKLIFNVSRRETFEVLIYCYDKYSDMHTDVLLDIFTKVKHQEYDNNKTMQNCYPDFKTFFQKQHEITKV